MTAAESSAVRRPRLDTAGPAARLPTGMPAQAEAFRAPRTRAWSCRRNAFVFHRAQDRIEPPAPSPPIKTMATTGASVPNSAIARNRGAPARRNPAAKVDPWHAGMFSLPAIPDGRWALATYFLDDDLPLLHLDDARNLYARGLRPTQVIERNRAATQAWALSVYEERDDQGIRKWQGIKWWSYHRPHWRIIGYWGNQIPHLLAIEGLSLASPAVADAAISLRRYRKSYATLPVHRIPLPPTTSAMREEILERQYEPLLSESGSPCWVTSNWSGGCCRGVTGLRRDGHAGRS